MKISLHRENLVAIILTSLIFFIVGLFYFSSTVKSDLTIKANSIESSASVEEQKPKRIRNAIDENFILKSTDKGLNRVESVAIHKYDDNSYDVTVTINSNSRDGVTMMRSDSIDIYTALYKHDLNVRKATVNVNHQFSDEYGNLANQIAITTSLSYDVASKINFDADKADLRTLIVPKHITKTYIHEYYGYPASEI